MANRQRSLVELKQTEAAGLKLRNFWKRVHHWPATATSIAGILPLACWSLSRTAKACVLSVARVDSWQNVRRHSHARHLEPQDTIEGVLTRQRRYKNIKANSRMQSLTSTTKSCRTLVAFRLARFRHGTAVQKLTLQEDRLSQQYSQNLWQFLLEIFGNFSILKSHFMGILHSWTPCNYFKTKLFELFPRAFYGSGSQSGLLGPLKVRELISGVHEHISGRQRSRQNHESCGLWHKLAIN